MCRLTELLVSLILLVLLLPVYVLLSVIILLKLGPPIFFIQKRTGFKMATFKLCKFRTMTLNIKGEYLPDSERQSKFGNFLRKASLDELPSLVNVIKGDMSLVGPRPLLVEYLPLYNREQRRRHEVKPGITGLAQINGRNTISWEDKFRFDIWYVDNRTLILDIKIILLTILKVFKMEGINQQGHVTMEEFKGSED